MGEDVVLCLFGMWSVCCVLVLFPRFEKFIRRADLLALIPEWRFFAPIPGQHDFYLLFRDRLEDGTISDWQELASLGRRRWWHGVWNPKKRSNKALFDVVQAFTEYVSAGDRALKISIPYLTLLNHVSSVPRPVSAKFTQFLLMYSHGKSSEEPSVFYLSDFHLL
jgi:hypothetical protein